MGTTTSPVTFAEFERMPENGKRYELRHGEVIELPPPKSRHYFVQLKLQSLLSSALANYGMVGTEFPFRPLPEHEFWIADIAAVSNARLKTISPEDNLHGSPELVIEVLSPSNTYSEMLDQERTCFLGGAIEFWLVDPEARVVRVTRANETYRTYTASETIPLESFGGGTLSAASLFDFPGS